MSSLLVLWLSVLGEPDPGHPALVTPGTPALAATPNEAAAEPAGRSGRLGWGAGLEVLGVGLAQAFTSRHVASGLSLLTAYQGDLGPRWAFRLPLSIDSTVRHGDAAYLAVAFTPGLVHRWRRTQDQRWVPYLGAGLRLAGIGVRRDFVDLPLVQNGALFIDGHHFGGLDGSHHDDPNLDSDGTVSPELWAGWELHPNRWIAWIFGVTYTLARPTGTTLHLLREGVSFRLTL